jgi:hypothetical protein
VACIVACGGSGTHAAARRRCHVRRIYTTRTGRRLRTGHASSVPAGRPPLFPHALGGSRAAAGTWWRGVAAGYTEQYRKHTTTAAVCALAYLLGRVINCGGLCVRLDSAIRYGGRRARLDKIKLRFTQPGPCDGGARAETDMTASSSSPPPPLNRSN